MINPMLDMAPSGIAYIGENGHVPSKASVLFRGVYLGKNAVHYPRCQDDFPIRNRGWYILGDRTIE